MPHHTADTLTLYAHPFALYCQKVMIALSELGVAYRLMEEQRDFERAELAELWPPASMPVLVAGARLVGSLDARRWDRICDQYVSDQVQAIVLDTIDERFDARTGARARGRLEMAYGM